MLLSAGVMDRTMRCIVPPDVAETSIQKMLDDGLPSPVARRVWQCRCLWLLSMHNDDIKKVIKLLTIPWFHCDLCFPCFVVLTLFFVLVTDSHRRLTQQVCTGGSRSG